LCPFTGDPAVRLDVERVRSLCFAPQSRRAPMNPCPSCHELSITAWQTSLATRRFPVRCDRCGGLSYVPGWRHAITIVVVEGAFWGTIIIALALRSWLALLACPAIWLAWYALGPSQFELKTTDAASAAAARKRAVRYVIALMATLLMAGLLLAVVKH
jgi:hypothetical protein